MATTGLDQSLDQVCFSAPQTRERTIPTRVVFLEKIMQSRPKNRRGGSSRRASAPNSGAANAGNNNASTARQRYSTAVPDSKRGSPTVAAGAATPAQSVAQKIMVSGLPPDVNEEQIKVCVHHRR